MPRDLTLILETILQSILGGPRHHWRCSGRHHYTRIEQHAEQGHHTVPMSSRCFGDNARARPSTPPLPPPPQDIACPRMLQQPPSHSSDWPIYWSMEPFDPEASPRGHRGRLCAIHGWGSCPTQVASM
jgi:hypothetical protein